MIKELPPTGSMEELIVKSQLPLAKIVRPRKEAGTSSQRPTRGVAQVEEEDKEEEVLSEDSERTEDSESTDTDTEEDSSKEHPAQGEQWDLYDEARERERRTKARNEAAPNAPRPPVAPKPREDPAVERIRRERMQELEERKVLAQKQQQHIISELRKRKQQEESTQNLVLGKRQRLEEQLEQGQTSGQETFTTPAQDEEEQQIPTQEPTLDVQTEGARDEGTHFNEGSPLSVKEAVEYEYAQE